MPRPDLTRVPEFYHNYINHVPENDLMTAFKNQTPVVIQFFQNIPENKIDYAYAQGKWTIKEILMHIMDDERIYAYRALRIARNDKTELPGFEQDDYVPYSRANERSIQSIRKEYVTVRKATLSLFRSFSGEDLQRRGTANNNVSSVRGLLYHLAGHELHHLEIIKEKYLV